MVDVEETVIIVKKGRELTERDMDLMNKHREKEFGKNEVKNFKKDYPLSSDYFFVMRLGRVVAFGIIRPIRISYVGKAYNILGLCSIISIGKGKGYGRVLMETIKRHLEKKGKSGLGFTFKSEFFKKVGFGVEKDFIKRFRYRNSRTGKIELDNNGDGIYYNGKDNFIEKVLSTKSIVYIDIPFW